MKKGCYVNNDFSTICQHSVTVEYERKAAFEKSEDEKKKNFATLLSERRRNKFHLKEQKLSPDSHNIAHAYDKKQPAEKLFVVKKTMGEAIKIQDQKVCESIKKYNLQVSCLISHKF